MTASQLDLSGWAITQLQLPCDAASALREQIFAKGEAGTRCLLDVPLRVAPGSHRGGILRSSEIDAAVQRHGETQCLARAGDALLIRPLLLHASSPATAPKHRRVLHMVYYSGDPIAEAWHRTV